MVNNIYHNNLSTVHLCFQMFLVVTTLVSQAFENNVETLLLLLPHPHYCYDYPIIKRENLRRRRSLNKHAPRWTLWYKWKLALVVYRTAVNIWPSPNDCQLASGTADIRVWKQTVRNYTVVPEKLCCNKTE